MNYTNDYEGQKDLLTDETLRLNPPFAGFWLRFAGYIIDAIICWVVLMIVIMLFGGGSFYWSSASDATYSTGSIITLLIAYIGVFLYFPLMESSSWQATLGKRAVGIKVTDMNGDRISFGRALGRTLGKILSGVILYIGFIMAGFTEKKQALHDMIAGTLVVKS